jgi:predicted Zn-ribbon and HTH transcriptional regulator
MEHSLVVNGESVSCPDGQKIALADLRDVSAPRILIGVDPSLQSGEASSGDLPGAVVVLKYQYQGVKGPPLVKFIPVASFTEADEIVSRIQQARKSARQGAGAAKVVVGKCEQCGRELRMKASAVRPSMSLTCKCGSLNRITGPAA